MNKYCHIIILIAYLSFSSVNSQAQSSDLKTGEWLKSWYLAEPFSLEESQDETQHLPVFTTDFLQEIGGELSPLIKNGHSFKYKGTTVSWNKYESPTQLVDLNEIITEESFKTAYAYTEIESEEGGLHLFSIGTDDGGRVWINGEQVWDCYLSRAVAADDDLIPVKLQKGKNTVLLKIEERSGLWGFNARFLPFNLKEYVSQQPLFKIHIDIKGAPELRFFQQKTTAEKLFKSVNLHIVDEKSQATLWQGAWSMGQKMPLPVSIEEYKKCKLVISSTLTDGSQWKKEIPFNLGVPIHYALFENGETDYSIVVAKDASESEQWAAKELQHWLKEISGVTFPIISDEGKHTGNKIIIGYNKHSLELLESGTKIPAANDESYLYKNIGSTILLLGGKERGAMYAVSSFLENELGCRWYTPKVSVIPPKTSYSFNHLSHSESPSIRVRVNFFHEALDPSWVSRNKINGTMDFSTGKGSVNGYWGVHTFYHFMPPSEFFASHPEYYSLIDGERIHERAQLCLTNPDVLDIVTERLKKLMVEKPDFLIYSVSQGDWENPCQCDKCQAIAKKEKSEAGPVIWFVNQVADRIKAEFPDKYVGTLAYTYTRKPPATIKPRDNVIVRLCSIECCFSHAINSCPVNNSFMEDMENWAAIAPQLYIWDYVVNFRAYLLPYPNFKVLQSNIKTFLDNKAIGILELGSYQSRGGEFAELRAYLISKLLWNVDSDVDLIIDDFIVGYYGRSGQYIRAYFDLLHNLITPEMHIHFNHWHDDLLSDEFIREADKIFDKAEMLAESIEILHRVETARLPLIYQKCRKYPVESRLDGTYGRFCEIVEREEVTSMSETWNLEQFHKLVKSAK